MKLRTLFATSLLAATAILAVPAPATADGGVTICGTVQCLTRCPSVGGSGGVVGATELYVSQEAAVLCNARDQELAIAVSTALDSCAATMNYLFGSSCTTTCTCDPPVSPIGDWLRQIVYVTETGISMPASASTTTSAVYISCADPSNYGPGVVGATLTYGSTMGSIVCNAAVGTAYVAAGATFATCNNTSDYLIGNHNVCIIYIVA
ncbi:MAG: hypothetical protein V4510_01770 [bacterium]